MALVNEGGPDNRTTVMGHRLLVFSPFDTYKVMLHVHTQELLATAEHERPSILLM